MDRGSPVVHADETGWRENGVNGYVWTFSTPTERYFLRRGRNKEVVDEALGADFAGALVSDFYAAYHHYDGPKQRCWAHLLREIHDLRALYYRDKQLAQWADAVHRIYRQATAFSHPSGKQRRTATGPGWWIMPFGKPDRLGTLESSDPSGGSAAWLRGNARQLNSTTGQFSGRAFRNSRQC